MNTYHQIFNRGLLRLRHSLNRNCSSLGALTSLEENLTLILLERLSLIRRSFEKVAWIGQCPSEVTKIFPFARFFSLSPQQNTAALLDEEFLPFAEQSLDLLVSFLGIHQLNDVPGFLKQVHYCLKPDGLFLAAFLGGESLWQVRHVLQEAEEIVRGGISPRIMPLIALPDAAALLYRAGFSLPVVDYDPITLYYDHPLDILKDLRHHHLTNILWDQSKTFMPKSVVEKFVELYQHYFTGEDGRVAVTYQVVYMNGWAPASTQQKPLLPGQAVHQLADFL